MSKKQKQSDVKEFIYEETRPGLWHCNYILNGQVKGVGWGKTKSIARKIAMDNATE